MSASSQARVAVVTGGAGGIGEACVARLKQDGWKVAILDRNMDLARQVAGRQGAVARQMDLADAASIADAAAWVEAEVGPCSALACVAAHLENPHAPEEQDFEEWDAIVRTNLTGTFRTLTSFGKAMLERGAGSIVTIGSITAFNSSPLQAYGPTKAGIINMSRNFAVSWGRRGIRVNCVCPGPTRTPAVEASYARGERDPGTMIAQTALGRLVEPAQVANVVAFLLSDEAGAITGIELPVDFREHSRRSFGTCTAACRSLLNIDGGDPMAHELDGQVVLVTGGGRGIGAAAARLAAARGAAVGVLDIDGHLARQTAGDVRAAGGKALELVSDVSDRAAMLAAADDLRRAFGPLTGVVNDAIWIRYGPIEAIEEDVVDHMLAVGVKGTFWGVQALLAHRGKGPCAVVNLASPAADLGMPNAATYTAVKGAIVALTRQMAVELGPQGIRVNAVAPGAVPTPGARAIVDEAGYAKRRQQTPLGRLGEEEEIAAAIAFLLGGDARFITGEVLHVDGGISVKSM